jgi:hypothetical protein
MDLSRGLGDVYKRQFLMSVRISLIYFKYEFITHKNLHD